MIGSGFKEVLAKDTKLHINKIVPDVIVSSINWENFSVETAANLLVWDGSGYSSGTYFWTGEVPNDVQEMVKEELDLPSSFEYNNIWVDGEYAPVDVSFPSGTAFWIQDFTQDSFTSAKITIFGEVLTNDEAIVPTPATTRLSMVANTLPILLNPNKMTFANVSSINWENFSVETAANLLIWDGSGYSSGTYFWTGEVPEDVQEMVKEELNLPSLFDYNNIWVDGEYNPADVSIKVGQGFWIDNPIADKNSSVAFPGL